MENYCRFMVKELVQHVKTSHVLVAQWDGYVLNPEAWKNEWLDYDYIGAIWPDGVVGNGGFSLRSKRLLLALQDEQFKPPFNPEDHRICLGWRNKLENDYHIRFAPSEVAAEFSIEGGRWTGQFGFHSFLTRLPNKVNKPLIFHQSGDSGDIIYGLASVKALGGGVFYVAPSKWGVRQSPTLENSRNILSLINQQKYIWSAAFTGDNLSHADYDLNKFREFYINGDKRINESIFSMALRACGTSWPEDKPWLEVDFKSQVPGRPIVIARSTRYHNNLFPWASLVKQNGKQMIFIGTAYEHSEFLRQFGLVPHFQTSNLMDVARIIAGSRVFIGNQSSPMAIALGLGVNVIQETWFGTDISLGESVVPCWNKNGDANCMLERENAIYVVDDKVSIPPKWLK